MSCRRLAAALAACALTLPSAALSAQGFEGTVTYKMNSASGKPGQLVYQVKGTQIRADITGAPGAPPGGMYLLMDATAGRMMSVMPGQKMYMTMDMTALGEQMKGKQGGKITKTGRSETIAGHRCHHYLVGEKQDSDICAAKGLGVFMGGGAGRRMFGGLPAGFEGYEEFAKDGFLPLKISTLKAGKEQVVMEATSVERKALDPGLFAVPAGYQEMDMSKMMQQMPSARKPAGK
jgi:hypothetical protein